MKPLPTALYRLSLALIFGGTVMFIVFAPVLFGILPTYYPENGRHISGLVVGRTISVLQVAGVVCGLLSALAGGFLSKGLETRFKTGLRIGGGLLIALLSAFSALYITSKMDALRTTMPHVIDAVSATHPSRVAFNTLHKLSSAVHLTILATTATLLVLPDPSRNSAEG